MKTLILFALAACTALVVAQAPAKSDCCESKKVVAQVEKPKAECCESKKVVAQVEKAKGECCESKKVVAQVEKAKSECCESKKVVAQVEKAKGECCDSKANPLKIYNTKEEEAFFAEARRMELGGKDECCKSTEAKVLAKGAPGCCNAPGEPAKFMVKVGKETKYFGCEGSAGKFVAEAKTKGMKPGKVQKVVGKVAMK